MDTRSLRAQALALATQLPETKSEAIEVYELLGELLECWIYPPSAAEEDK
jgi:hypothetical protein